MVALSPPLRVTGSAGAFHLNAVLEALALLMVSDSDPLLVAVMVSTLLLPVVTFPKESEVPLSASTAGSAC